MENHIKYSKGVSWIDDVRIPFENGDKTINHNTVPGSFVGSVGYSEKIYHENIQGRFPANILVSDDMLNDGVITKQSQRTYKPTDNSASLFGNSPQSHGIGIGDKGSNSRYYNIDGWFNNLIDV
jgi:hypothetical protein